MQFGPVVPQETILAFSTKPVNPFGKETKRVAPSDFVLFEGFGLRPGSAGTSDPQKARVCATHGSGGRAWRATRAPGLILGA